MSQLTRYRCLKDRLFEQEKLDLESWPDGFVEVYLADEVEARRVSMPPTSDAQEFLTSIEGTVALPYALTREQQLELQRNTEIKENEALRATLEAVERERDAYKRYMDNDVAIYLFDEIEKLLPRLGVQSAYFTGRSTIGDFPENGGLDETKYLWQIAIDELKQQLTAAREQVARLERDVEAYRSGSISCGTQLNKKITDLTTILLREQTAHSDCLIKNRTIQARVQQMEVALAQAQRETWEQAAKVAENNFPFAATEGERLALHQCLRIAEKCRQQAGGGG